MSEHSSAGFAPAERRAFACRRCGHCCRGTGGIVVSGMDLERLCAFTRTGAEDFERVWGERRGGKLHIRTGEDSF